MTEREGESAALVSPGGFVVPTIYGTFDSASFVIRDPELLERYLRESAARWDAKPWHEKATIRLRRVRRELGWRARTSARILLHGDDGSGDE